MTIKEKVLEVQPTKDGISAKGTPYSNREIILQTDERYPRIIDITFKGENCKKLDGIAPGDKVEITFDPESHKFEDKYYTSLIGYQISVLEKANQPVV